MKILIFINTIIISSCSLIDSRRSYANEFANNTSNLNHYFNTSNIKLCNDNFVLDSNMAKTVLANDYEYYKKIEIPGPWIKPNSFYKNVSYRLVYKSKRNNNYLVFSFRYKNEEWCLISLSDSYSDRIDDRFKNDQFRN